MRSKHDLTLYKQYGLCQLFGIEIVLFGEVLRDENGCEIGMLFTQMGGHKTLIADTGPIEAEKGAIDALNEMAEQCLQFQFERIK